MFVEKRVAGIIRWLERLKQSYSSGAIESALMDAECARADMEDFCQSLALWSKVRPEASKTVWINSFVRAIPLAAIIVMMMVIPLSKEIMPPLTAEQPVEEIVLAEPVIVIREEEEVEDEAKPVLRKSAPAQKRQAATKRTAKAQPSKPQTSASKTGRQNTASVAYDQVFSLLQTGQRALKNTSTVIKLD